MVDLPNQNQEEQIIRFQELQEQLQVFHQQLLELQHLTETLEHIEKPMDSQEILFPLASGIFTQGTIKENPTIFLHLGAGVVVEKSVSNALTLLAQQEQALEVMKNRIESELLSLLKQLNYQ